MFSDVVRCLNISASPIVARATGSGTGSHILRIPSVGRTRGVGIISDHRFIGGVQRHGSVLAGKFCSVNRGTVPVCISRTTASGAAADILGKTKVEIVTIIVADNWIAG